MQFNPLQSIIFLTNRTGRLLSHAVWEKVDGDLVEIMQQHMGIFIELWQQDGLRQQDLALSVLKDKATITRSLRFLESKNMLVRVADPQDKRTKRIYLTHKGQDLRNYLIPKAKATIEEATTGIDEQEFETCKKVLVQIYQNLNSCEGNK